MKYYCLGNLYIGIESDKIIKAKEAKMNLFALEKENVLKDKEKVICVNLVKKLRIPKESYDIRDGNCLIWMRKNIRAYVEKDQIYAVFSEKCDQQYILEIQQNFCHCITTERQLLNHLSLEKIFLENDSFVLHSSFIKYQERGLLFFAPSGTGKSTQADLWKKYESATIVNGDRSLIHCENGTWKAYGLPFSGNSDYCKNESAELHSLIYLSQAKENCLKKLSLAEAIKKVISETTINYWDRDFVNKVISMIEELVKNIPVYSFACTKDFDAVNYLKKNLFGETYENRTTYFI